MDDIGLNNHNLDELDVLSDDSVAGDDDDEYYDRNDDENENQEDDDGNGQESLKDENYNLIAPPPKAIYHKNRFEKRLIDLAKQKEDKVKQIKINTEPKFKPIINDRHVENREGTIHDRLFQLSKKPNIKIEEERKNVRKKEMSECTFHPIRFKPPRYIQEIERDYQPIHLRYDQIKQSNYQQNQENDEIIDEVCTFRPQINQYPNSDLGDLQSRINSSIQQWVDRKNKSENNPPDLPFEEYPFSPIIKDIGQIGHNSDQLYEIHRNKLQQERKLQEYQILKEEKTEKMLQKTKTEIHNQFVGKTKSNNLQRKGVTENIKGTVSDRPPQRATLTMKERVERSKNQKDKERKKLIDDVNSSYKIHEAIQDQTNKLDTKSSQIVGRLYKIKKSTVTDQQPDQQIDNNTKEPGIGRPTINKRKDKTLFDELRTTTSVFDRLHRNPDQLQQLLEYQT